MKPRKQEHAGINSTYIPEKYKKIFRGDKSAINKPATELAHELAKRILGTQPSKPRRFFIHYNKPETQRRKKVTISVHHKNTCHMVDNVVCAVPTEGKVNKRQPYFVMQGFAHDVQIKNKIAYIQ